MNRLRQLSDKEQGAALIVALIMLVIMALLGVAAMQNTTMEERMAGNVRQQYRAFQAAEAGLRWAEEDIDEGADDAMDCDDDFEDVSDLEDDDFTAFDTVGDEAGVQVHFRYCGPKKREYTNEDGETVTSDSGAQSMIYVYYYKIISVARVENNSDVILVSAYAER